jgi:hypothetical protein
MWKAAGLEHLADDAIVVMEKHHPPSGSRHESRRCSHTGLIAVFILILLIGGIVGRLFVSLTATRC